MSTMAYSWLSPSGFHGVRVCDKLSSVMMSGAAVDMVERKLPILVGSKGSECREQFKAKREHLA